MKFENYIMDVKDFPKKGVVFKDITPLLEDADTLNALMIEMASKLKRVDFDKIVCADARGFLFGTAIGMLLHKGVCLVRKKGKLPRPGYSVSYDLEYGSATFELTAGTIQEGDRCVIIDDLLATGGSAKAMEELIHMAGGGVVQNLFLIELMEFNARTKLSAPTQSILKYGLYEGMEIFIDISKYIDAETCRYSGMFWTKVISYNDMKVTFEYDLEYEKYTLEVALSDIKKIRVEGKEFDYLP